MNELRALPLVTPATELRGVAPPALERAFARAAPGDPVHRGLVRVSTCIARHALATAAPPSACVASLAALATAEAWADGACDAARVKKARSEAWSALIGLEKATRDAIARALVALEPKATTPIDEHADRAVLRWARLGAHYAGSSAVLCLDGVETPRTLASVPQQAAGAVAYAKVGMGPARGADLRQRACEQAEWENERGETSHAATALAIQLFHEFLGASWKDLSDAYRAHYFDFVEWALPRPLASS
jgi:hypothetical protein